MLPGRIKGDGTINKIPPLQTDYLPVLSNVKFGEGDTGVRLKRFKKRR